MTWHVDTVPPVGLASLLARIRNMGGTVVCSTPGTDGVRVTWTSAGSGIVDDAHPRAGRR
jgi:signal transduction histidine kinase